MSATYIDLPVSIPTIMEAIVDEVSVNLAAEATLDIDNVAFYCETWMELCEKLSIEGNSSDHQATRYPMIALIRNYDERVDSRGDVTARLTFVIVNSSSPDKYSSERETDNYIPILRPIYAEFMQVIADSSYFIGYNRPVEHTRTESMHLGVGSNNGNTAYKLPDCVDGIIVSDLELKFAKEACLDAVSGASITLVYLNNIAEVNISNLGEASITVELTDANYTNTLDPQVVTYQAYFGHEEILTAHDITIGGNVNVAIDPHTVSGYYTGYIVCDDGTTEAKMSFGYYITGGRVTRSMTRMRYELMNFDLTGVNYTNYHFHIEWLITSVGALINSVEIQSDNATEVLFPSTSYSPALATIPLTDTECAMTVPTTYRDVQMVLVWANQVIEHYSYYKTQ